jgi:hypothetical protein
VEAALTLEQVDLFAGAPMADLLALAARSRTIPVQSGTALMSEAEPPALVVLVSATATLERTDGSATIEAGAGDAIGAHASLMGRPAGWRGVASSPGTIVRIESADLLQVLGERAALLQRVFARIIRRTTPDSAARIQALS